MPKSIEDYVKELNEVKHKSKRERNFALVGLVLLVILVVLYVVL